MADEDGRTSIQLFWLLDEQLRNVWEFFLNVGFVTTEQSRQMNILIVNAQSTAFTQQPLRKFDIGTMAQIIGSRLKGQPIKTFRVGASFTLVIGDTGISAPTKESVGAVRSLHEAEPTRWDKVFNQVGEIVWDARQAIERGDTIALGTLMDANHALLQEMTVSCEELDKLTEAARKAGALGAKLSGGGRGGNMIALVLKEKASAMAETLLAAGAKRTIITTVRAR